MNVQAPATGTAVDPRAGCSGVVPLTARLEPWQLALCRQPALLAAWLEQHGSPLNLIDPAPLARNAAELQRAAGAVDVELRIFFARKANKALTLVEQARRLGLGIDVASERELRQVLDGGVAGRDVVVTAAVKPRALLELCVASGATVAIDNEDELELLAQLAQRSEREHPIALRLAPLLAEERPQTRFGLTCAEALAIVGQHWTRDGAPRLAITGVHFHLDGYDAAERVTAIGQSLELVDALRERGHRPTFVDIGGGIPISYLDDAAEWERFWSEHRAALLGRRAALTFEGHGLGLSAHAGELLGRPSVYPSHQQPTRGPWLEQVLRATVDGGGRSVAEAVRARGLQLHCEPGRSLLDGCGLTAARVEFRKQRRDGTWLIGLAMNRTQCRSAAEDFLVDPLLLATGAPDVDADARATGPIEGYLVGAYCIERELLTWRRLRFPRGVARGDVVVFPNTAGYLMHILESASHQIPLARNLVVGSAHAPSLDPIDGSAER